MIYLGALKEKYRDLYAKHEVHYVEKNVIKTRRPPIDEFAVKVKIVGNRDACESYKGELEKVMEDLNADMVNEMTIDQLIEENHRISYIRGMPGMGKSVLAKQIVFGWATGTMYTHFNLCLFFECRDFNNYIISETGRDGKKNALFLKFLNEKLFGYNARDGKGMLIVIDGVDELFDIHDKKSVIYQILDMSKLYRKSKIILTGRPHVQAVVDRTDIEMGDCAILEILGLGDKQVEEYIEKFAKCVDEESVAEYFEIINKMKASSHRIRSMMATPQVLNTMCCIAVLTEGTEIRNSTEVNCWTLFLLLKQHIAERESEHSSHFISQIFEEYSRSLILFCKIAYELLKENEIIFARSRFESIFEEIDQGSSAQ